MEQNIIRAFWDEGVKCGRYGGNPPYSYYWTENSFKQGFYHGRRLREEFERSVMDEMVGYI